MALVEYQQIMGHKGEHFLPEAPYTPWGPKALYIHFCAMLTGTIRQLGKTCSYGGRYLCLCLADNTLGPCVTGKDEGDPGRDGEPGSPIWPAK